MRTLGKRIGLLTMLVLSQYGFGQIVEFHIKAGTKSQDWNTKDTNSEFWIKAGAREEEDSEEELQAVTLEQVLTAYPAIQKPLVTDDLGKAQFAAQALKELSAKWLAENPSELAVKSVSTIRTGAELLENATDLDDARIAFIKISQGAIEIIRASSAVQAQWQLFFCPMVAKQQGYWVQPKNEKLANPYMGGAMPGCGSKKPW